MKRALRLAPVAVVLIALAALAAPKPVKTVTISGSGVVPVVYSSSAGASFIVQCPDQAVFYRGLNAAEVADGGFGLVTLGAGMTDGGTFGVKADFRVQSDPIGIVLTGDQVGLGFLGHDAGGTYPCFLSTP